MSKFIPTLKVVNEYDWMMCDVPVEYFKVLKDGSIEVEDEEGRKAVIDEDTLCDLYGDEAAGGAAFVEGGAMLFETLEEQETWERQK